MGFNFTDKLLPDATTAELRRAIRQAKEVEILHGETWIKVTKKEANRQVSEGTDFYYDQPSRSKYNFVNIISDEGGVLSLEFRSY